MGQPGIVRFRAVQHVQKCLVLAARNHEQALIEQSLFRSLVGCIKNKVGQRLVGHFGRTARSKRYSASAAPPVSGTA